MSFIDSSSQFGITPANVVYLDSAGRSLLPKSVEFIGIEALKQKSTPWNGIGSTQAPESVRETFAKIINATGSNCIAIAPSTGFAMSLAAKNIIHMGVLHAGTSVLLIEKDMASAVYPWQDACAYTCATLRIVDDPRHTNEDLSWFDAIIEQLDEDVSVIVVPGVHWCDGSLIELEKLADFLAQIPIEQRPFLVVDGTQSIGAMPIDVQRIKPTFMACSVHKWLNAPYGMSLMYLDPSLHDLWDPLDQHERSRKGADEAAWDEVNFMDNLTGYPVEFMHGARRIDAGGHPNPITMPMVAEALSLTLKWDAAKIQRHLTSLTDLIAEKLVAVLGTDIVHIRPKAQRCGHILGVRLSLELTEGVVQADKNNTLYNISSLGKELKQYGIHVSIRAGVIRISPYIHNTVADVARFVTVFIQLVVHRMLKYAAKLPLSLKGLDISTPIAPEVAVFHSASTDAAIGIAEAVDSSSSPSGGDDILRSASQDSGECVETFTNSEKIDAPAVKEANDGDRLSPIPVVSGTKRAPQLNINPAATAVPMPLNSAPMKVRILLTGASGWLGQVVTQAIIAKSLSDNFELYAGFNRAVPEWVLEEFRTPFDLTDRTSVETTIERIRPHVVIHTAAMASPVACHKDPSAAMQVNAPEYLIDAVRAVVPDCLFLFTSTDMVYDGESPPYSLISTPKPVNVYGESKLKFESKVTSLKHGIVLRLSNMIGRNFTFQNAGCKFTQFLSEACARREFVSIRTDEVRSFVHVDDVVNIIMRAIRMHSTAHTASEPSTPTPGAAGSRPVSMSRGSITSNSVLSSSSSSNSLLSLATSCPGCTRKVFNVGGPSGLSRMQLARVVAEAMGVTLKITHCQSSPLEENVWEVSAATAIPPVPTTGELLAPPPPAGGGAALRSPRDISMNSVMTENYFQIKFSDIDAALLSGQCL